MLIKTRGIVFRTIKYSETSVIVDVYTEERGLRKYIVNGVRSKKARISPSLLQVMSLVEMVAYEREDRDLQRIKEIRPAYVYHSLPFNVRKGAVGLFMAEIARKAIRESEENRSLFNFLFNSFAYLDETRESISNLHLVFLLELSVHLGFVPGGRHSAVTPFFDLMGGVFVEKLSSQHTHYVDEALSGFLHELLHSSLQSSHEITLSRDQRRSLLLLLIDYFRLHVERMPEIHSHLILQEVLE
jgi:DNA repair protein RecO (recombination protein O)